MGQDRCHECVYTLGHYRPGSCAPWQTPDLRRPQAARQGRARRHRGRGRDLHRQGGRAHGAPRHRRRAARRRRPRQRRDRPAANSDAGPLQRGQGPPARLDGRCPGLPVGAARSVGRKGCRGHRVRARIRPRTGGDALHVVAAAGHHAARSGTAAVAGRIGGGLPPVLAGGLRGPGASQARRGRGARREPGRPIPDTAPPSAGGSVALVLADRRRRVAEQFAATFPHLAPLRPSVLSGSGRAAGALAGQRADLGGGVGLGVGRRRALGA